MTQLPDPLTPADCDLRGLEYMPLHGAKLFASDFYARASDAEFRAAMSLWWESWQQVPAASLPDDDVVLCRLADLARDIRTWKKIKAMAMHGFVLCSDGRWYHSFLAEQALVAWDKRVKERERKALWREKKQGRDEDVPRDRTGTGGGTGRGRDADVPADGNRRDGNRRDKEEGSIPDQPKVPDPPRPDAPEGFDRVLAAAGLRPKPAALEREVGLFLDWIGLGLDVDEIVVGVQGFLAQHDGRTSSLARFGATMAGLASQKRERSKAAKPSGAPPKGTDQCEDAPVIRQALLSEFGEQTYASWFRPCDLSRDGDALIVRAQSRVAADWIRNHMIDRVRVASRVNRVEVVAA